MTYSSHPAAVHTRNWRKANPERASANRARYRGKHKETLAAKQRERAEKNREGEVARVLRWKAENPDKWNSAQGNAAVRKADRLEQLAGRPRSDACEICEAPPNGRRLAFDHCHDKGHFRGWICHRCNLTLGLVKDDMSVLQKLIDYLLEDAMNQPFAPLERRLPA